ncbi:hypothetical protein LTR36_007155 [Oleoguttula mirabilis]|uniref:Short-chain dehydrogenase/reductase 3 n=1 Tax=Oleoguttula mirabilis TaxID=1507867 RepID=A0AAV9JA07_9PEZI|nr:hypothetical protein LTR36_007155 [Oleoguttula mirabilis]
MASLISKVPLNPLLTAPLLFLLTLAPENIRQRTIQQLRQYVSKKSIAKAITTLKWLTALGLARWLSNYASQLAQNNFRFASEKHRYNWPQEIALITGAAGGFGSLMSKDLASKGVTIIAVDIAPALPPDMQKDPRIHYYNCDITSKPAVDELARRIQTAHGDPSILINNAGIAHKHRILDATPASLQSIFAVNILSHYYTAQAFLPAMLRAKKGHVVTLASMASFVSPAEMVSYANTKAAALSFHEGLAAEVRAVYNVPEIKFTVVHPTFAATGLIRKHEADLKRAGVLVIDPQMVADAVVAQILSGRGAQLVIPDDLGVVSCMRAYPHWLAQGMLRLGERAGGEAA